MKIRTQLTLLLLIAWPGTSQTDPNPASKIAPVRTRITVTADPVEPTLDHRNSEVFDRTLFSRDDQLFHVLDAGINAGQHEGGGKSVEIRRFGFNVDHGGVAGGLKVLVDGVPQNQSTQGHGQGYLGSLKSLTPELVQEVHLINGPFSAAYGDFSGLGVVQIRTRESLPDQMTLRLQGGSFGTFRTFVAYSPNARKTDALIAYEGSRSQGPFLAPLDYSRDNFTGNYIRSFADGIKCGVKGNGGRNTFNSSGQIPLDEVAAGRLDRFGFVDPTDGGHVQSGTMSGLCQITSPSGRVISVDGFVGRSLFDLYSNFTFFLLDPERGDAIQQHDSRLQEGVNAQLQQPHRVLATGQGLFVAGVNLHDNQILVGLYSRDGRTPIDVQTLAHAHVTNGGTYVQESLSFLNGRLLLSGGLRFDEFRFGVRNLEDPNGSGVQSAGRWQPKAGIAFTPSPRVPLTFHFNYGRGISSSDARVVVQRPENPRVANTDFYQAGTSHHFGRFSATASAFLIDRSHEQVYIPDDGTFEFRGPSRAYGLETKGSVELTRHVSMNAGLTKVMNAFYRGTAPRIYVDSAPHFVANAGLTVTNWAGWSGSLRMRAINHYRLDGEDPTVAAAGHTVFDFGVSRRVNRHVEFNFTLDNLTDRSYYETQNYFESRLPGQPVIARIHGTPGYPITAMAGMTFRGWGK